MNLHETFGARRRRRAERRPLIEMQQPDPLVEEDELPEAKPRPGRGGSKSDLPVLGIGNYCWCGEPMRHGWPGKSEGAPHPARRCSG